MAEWRFIKGWSDAEMATRIDALTPLVRNFDPAVPDGWAAHRSTAIVASELPGQPLPHGPFDRLCTAIGDYEFSDPGIVTAHFDPAVPLQGRRLLLELKVLGLRYLCAAAVVDVREEHTDDATYFGFRYDTLEGHIERGEEWFLLTKLHATGDIRFEISARWREGDFPNWWSRLGFKMLGQHYQKKWHTRAHQRLAFLAAAQEGAITRDRYGRRVLLAHEGPAIAFTREQPVIHQENVEDTTAPKPSPTAAKSTSSPAAGSG